MPLTININDLTLAHKGSNGTAIATIPDVCKTPSPGGPVPLPYPNIARSADLAKGTTTIKADGGNMCANKGSELARSTGDEAGTAGGVKSSTFIKEATWMLYSFDVMLEGKNACRLTDKLFMNHQNTVCAQGWIQDYMAAERVNEDTACSFLGQYIDYVIGQDNNTDTVEDHPNPDRDRDMEGRSIDYVNPDDPKGRRGKGVKKGLERFKDRSLRQRMMQNRGFDLDEDNPGCPPGTDGWAGHDVAIANAQAHLGCLLNDYERDCGGKRGDKAEKRAYKKRLERGRAWENMNPPQPEHWQVRTNQVPLGW